LSFNFVVIQKFYNPEVSSIRAYAALAVGVFSISWSAIFIRWAPMAGPASALYRLLFAGMLLYPYVWLRRKPVPRKPNSWLLAALGGVFFAADLSLYSTAVLNSSAANATVLANNSPIIVGLLAWIFTRSPPRPAFWIGLTAAVLGCALIVGADVLHKAEFGRADLLAVAASACFAVYLFVTERMREQFDTAMLLAVSLAASTLALLAFNLAAGISLHIPDEKAWMALLALALVCQLLGYFSLTYALGHLSAGVTSVTLLVQAPLTALFAFLLLREPITPAQAIGGMLVLSGIWIVNRYSRRQMILAE
jgi:drug/metabolite transporter (DMT)-like permease